MRLRLAVENVEDTDAACERCVRDQRSVTPPGHGFGAHDHRRLERRQLQKIINRVGELAGVHVVRIRAEARVPPLGVA